MEKATWRIRAERMKAGVGHRIPLSREALALLAQTKIAVNGEYVFSSNGKPLGSATMLMILRWERVQSTVYGFRSSFRQWC